MSITARSEPCLKPGCRLSVLLTSPLWHVRIENGQAQLSLDHDLGIDPDLDRDEEIEEYS